MIEQHEVPAPVAIPRPVEPPSPAPFDRDHLGLEFAAVLLATIAPNLVLAVLRFSGAHAGISAETLFAEAFMQAGWCLLLWYLLSRREAFGWNLPVSAGQWFKEVGWGLLLMVCLLVGTIAVGAVMHALGVHGSPGPWSQPLRDPSTKLVFCLLVPLAALNEELLFRVYVQSRLTRLLRGRPALVVLIGAGLFAVVHDYSLPGTMAVFVSGLIFAVSYQRNRRIPRLVIAHALLNLVLVALS